MGFFKKLLGGKASEGKVFDTVTYKDFSITPCPVEAAGGWSTEATIEKTIDGELKQHHFIRADKSASEAGALELIASKCQVLIDQRGNHLFD